MLCGILSKKILDSTNPVISLPMKDYKLYFMTQEDISTEYHSIEINSEIEEARHVYRKYEGEIMDLENTELVRILTVLKSKLNYFIYEYLSPNGFYFQLIDRLNKSNTRKEYIYELKYNDIPVYYKSEGEIDAVIMECMTMEVGVLIMTSWSLQVGTPFWYRRGMFKDMCNKMYNSNKYKYFKGKNTEEWYLWYDQPTIVTNVEIIDLIEEINQEFDTARKSKIFPTNTPDRFIKDMKLEEYGDQWVYNGKLPEYVNIFDLTISFWVKTLSELYEFLDSLNNYNPRDFKIYVRTYEVRIIYTTQQLSNYLNIIDKISKDYLNPNNIVYIYNPSVIIEDTKYKIFKFIDYESGENYTIVKYDTSDPTISVGNLN